MNIKELYYDNIGIARAIIESDSGAQYCTSVDSELFRSWCSCPYYVFNNTTCKHIIHLMNNLEYDKMTKKTNLNFIDTGSKTVDDLLGGGIPYGIVTAIFGEPTSGKTMFGKQMGLVNIAKTGKKTILIETEGLRDYDTKVLLYKFMNRWNLDKKTVDDKFTIKHTLGDVQLQSIQKLLQMFGYIASFEISKKGKYSTKFNNCTPTISDKEFRDTPPSLEKIFNKIKKSFEETFGPNINVSVKEKKEIKQHTPSIISEVDKTKIKNRIYV